jgi:hypothetical protein
MPRKKKKSTNHHRIVLDFTVVLLIILFLFIGTAKVYNSGVAENNNNIRKNNLAELQVAFESFYQQYRVFPRAVGAPVDAHGKIIPQLSSAKNAIEALLLGSQLTKAPKDPEPNFRYIYVVANKDNFSGGEKLQRYALYAIKQEVIPNFATTLSEVESPVKFLAAGNSTEQFSISTLEYNELMLGDRNIPRRDGKIIVQPNGGTALAF